MDLWRGLKVSKTGYFEEGVKKVIPGIISVDKYSNDYMTILLYGFV